MNTLNQRSLVRCIEAAIMRLGYGPPAGATPRRPVGEILREVPT
jgi:hypothetical protein